VVVAFVEGTVNFTWTSVSEAPAGAAHLSSKPVVPLTVFTTTAVFVELTANGKVITGLTSENGTPAGASDGAGSISNSLDKPAGVATRTGIGPAESSGEIKETVIRSRSRLMTSTCCVVHWTV
jgi:hypothetical protein